MRKVVYVLTALFLCGVFSPARAQHVAVGTNAIEWLNLGTVNAEGSVAVSRHYSLHASFRFNDWSFRKDDSSERFSDPEGDTGNQFQNRKQSYSAGVRYWPWYVYSGWWLSLRGQYMEYNRGGLFRKTTEEGDAYGAAVGIGYARMLSRHFNLEFGVSVWGGWKSYVRYRCPNCGTKTGEGEKMFFLPDDVFLSIVYIF